VSVTLPRRVGINAIFLLPGMGGLDAYVQKLVPELIRLAPQLELTVYCSSAGAAHLSTSPWAEAVRLASHPLFGARGLKAVTELTVLGALAGRQVDLVHSIALTAPLWTPAANVVTIADTTWLHGDHPDATTRLWRAVVPAVARRADRVIAISQQTADDIVTQLRVPADRIDITFLGHTAGVRPAPLPAGEVRARFALGDGPVVLMVGTRKPHKNVLGLLDAMPAVLAARPDTRLVLAGNPTAHEPELRTRAAALQLADRVSFLPFVDESELEGLYALADCFVLPSFNEGFGLPLLEAMGRGVPVACSNVSALPEVAGDAARYFDPTRPTEIARAIDELLSDPALRARLTSLGRAREAALTWSATAEQTLDSYGRAWHDHRRHERH
jgi:glycosyltransferase involved in cell wall biosynthesis